MSVMHATLNLKILKVCAVLYEGGQFLQKKEKYELRNLYY